ncbi:hypothetical protein [Maritalea sp.]|uniref:hypothetical protein n=1 Tax=Maritalea sp. TaxID=2003361 RepID=UPI003EF53C3C
MPDLTDAELLTAKVAEKHRVDFDDLQNEISGNATGRLTRFLNADSDKSADGKRRNRERQAEQYLRLIDLMKDPEYAALYVDLGDKLGDTEREADTAIALVQAELRNVEQAIEEMEERAARTPGGRIVLRMDDGQVLYADGGEVKPEIAEGIVWPQNAPSGDAYFAANQQRTQLSDHLSSWETYRYDTLGGIRDTYDDTDTPYQSVDELRKALGSIDDMRPDAVQPSGLTVAEQVDFTPTPQAFPTFN